MGGQKREELSQQQSSTSSSYSLTPFSHSIAANTKQKRTRPIIDAVFSCGKGRIQLPLILPRWYSPEKVPPPPFPTDVAFFSSTKKPWIIPGLSLFTFPTLGLIQSRRPLISPSTPVQHIVRRRMLLPIVQGRTQSFHGLLRERARDSIFRVKSRQSCSVSISSSHVIRFIVSG